MPMSGEAILYVLCMSELSNSIQWENEIRLLGSIDNSLEFIIT